MIEILNDVSVELVDHMGDDERICAAARVSTGAGDDPDRNAGLIKYLMQHRHGSPFEHGSPDRQGAGLVTKWVLVVTEPYPARCDEKPSPRSTARCENSPEHEEWHMGRTRGGYWKIWKKEVS